MFKIFGRKKKKGARFSEEWDSTIQQIVDGNVPPRIVRKAASYQKFLSEIAEKSDNTAAMREIILANRKLVFDDPDFLLYGMAQVKLSRERGDRANAEFWDQLIGLITNTIAIYG